MLLFNFWIIRRAITRAAGMRVLRKVARVDWLRYLETFIAFSGNEPALLIRRENQECALCIPPCSRCDVIGWMTAAITYSDDSARSHVKRARFAYIQRTSGTRGAGTRGSRPAILGYPTAINLPACNDSLLTVLIAESNSRRQMRNSMEGATSPRGLATIPTHGTTSPPPLS